MATRFTASVERNVFRCCDDLANRVDRATRTFWRSSASLPPGFSEHMITRHHCVSPVCVRSRAISGHAWIFARCGGQICLLRIACFAGSDIRVSIVCLIMRVSGNMIVTLRLTYRMSTRLHRKREPDVFDRSQRCPHSEDELSVICHAAPAVGLMLFLVRRTLNRYAWSSD